MPRSLATIIGKDAAVPFGAEGVVVTGITADSCAVQPGFVFAALPGTKVDGTSFIAAAFAQGAIAAIAPHGTIADGLIIATDNPRLLLAKMAARLSGEQPDTIIAVTGTNGKTSVAVFVRQIWEAMGFRAASLGTIGVVGPSGSEYLQHTTPDPVQLHALAAKLKEDHVDHLVVEASSHGLAQYRLDGLRLTAGGFTNITRDHLDYHETFDAYFEAKMRLFTELLPAGAGAVINADSPYGEEVRMRSESVGLSTFTVGRLGTGIQLLETRREGLEQHLRLKTRDGEHAITLPLVGDFQTSNALVAAGLVIAAGGEVEVALRALSSLKGATGRLDLVGRTANGVPVFVDYAHTPDALENVLTSLRPYASGKLIVVFGCGGDRDAGKRPMMGRIAQQHADVVIVTDDNPRSENPALIRQEILVGVPGAMEIGDRAAAIAQAISQARNGDLVLIAGKGHEEGQIIGNTTIPFSDHAAVRDALQKALT